MLRGSYATGQIPPTRDFLVESEFESSPVVVFDPKRGGYGSDFTERFVEKVGGNASLIPFT